MRRLVRSCRAVGQEPVFTVARVLPDHLPECKVEKHKRPPLVASLLVFTFLLNPSHPFPPPPLHPGRCQRLLPQALPHTAPSRSFAFLDLLLPIAPATTPDLLFRLHDTHHTYHHVRHPPAIDRGAGRPGEGGPHQGCRREGGAPGQGDGEVSAAPYDVTSPRPPGLMCRIALFRFVPPTFTVKQLLDAIP